MPTLDDIEIVEHAGETEWLQIVQLVGEHESWLLSDSDFAQWSNGFGADNFNLIVAVDKTTRKQVIGSVSTALYTSIDGSPPLVTVGMFFIRSEYRGLGLGVILFEKALSDPRFKGINKGLNGVPAMTKKYASKHGFDKYAKWELGTVEADTSNIVPTALESLAATEGVKIVNVSDVDFKQIVAYDVKQLGGIRRDGFLREILTDPTAFAKIAVDVNDSVVGVIKIRSGFGKQLAIGPWYADSDSIAAALLKHVVKAIPNLATTYKKLFIFPANTNKSAYNIFSTLAQEKTIDHGTMFGQFTNEVINTDAAKVFSLTEYAMSFV